MPDTLATLTVLPFMVAIFALLGCSRTGCLKLLQRLRGLQVKEVERPAGRF